MVRVLPGFYVVTELVLRQQISSVQIDELPSLYNES